jgi:NAD(P)-dependent dehydrogenase (short-subunit alcohol dehydrogenase family)
LVTDDATPAYHVSKAALLQLTRYYAVAFARYGIRVNSVSPGLVLKEQAAPYYRRHKALHNLYKKIVPLGRMASVSDVVDAVDFLCSDKASYVTGQNLVVDGGLSLHFQGSLARSIAAIKIV